MNFQEVEVLDKNKTKKRTPQSKSRTGRINPTDAIIDHRKMMEKVLIKK